MSLGIWARASLAERAAGEGEAGRKVTTSNLAFIPAEKAESCGVNGHGSASTWLWLWLWLRLA